MEVLRAEIGKANETAGASHSTVLQAELRHARVGVDGAGAEAGAPRTRTRTSTSRRSAAAATRSSG